MDLDDAEQEEPRLRPSPEGSMTMSDTAWLIVAVAVWMLVAAVWVMRERVIHRRRRRARREEVKE